MSDLPPTEPQEAAVTAENDDRSRFATPFDWDPGVGPRPAPRPVG